ncbi:MAG TPA: galactonate dehydratase [Nocardioidaceae bacterium]|nr:galactonate dehydratase [Nocardioidaceae bacterium]
MRITAVETFLVPPRWLFVRIGTDEGIVGWGEATLEGRSETARTAIHAFDDYLVGSDPLTIERHWQVLTRSTFYRGGPVFGSAVSGIDQALWDIAGKAYGVPVSALLGGAVRDRIRVYAWIGGDEPSQIAGHAMAQLEAGFTAVKMNASGRVQRLDNVAVMRDVVARAEAARSAMGDRADFAMDFHGRFSTAYSRRVIHELEPLHPLFIEEPVLPEYVERLADVVDSTTIPIACGERLFHRTAFLPALRAGIGVAQPDISHCGGISETRRVADLADTFDVAFAPHCPLGPLALAASLQVSAVTPNFLIQEQSLGIHYNVGSDLLDYLVDPAPFRFVDGHALVPEGPGLGIDVDEEAVRRAAEEGHAWRGPVWRHEDGSFAEW